MPFSVNDTQIFDANTNANVTQIVLNAFGSFTVASNVAPVTTPPHAGTISGYNAGGSNPATPAIRSTIQKFTFASEGAAVNTANLTKTRRRGHSASSETNGYVMGGDNVAGSQPTPAGAGYDFSIERYPFATDTNATMIGGLNYIKGSSGGGCASPTHGYSGGQIGFSSIYSMIERFAFSADSITTSVGFIQTMVASPCEFASLASGFVVTGNMLGSGSPFPSAPPAQTYQTTAVQKYMFANESDAVQVGDMTISRFLLSGLSSPTHGYAAGGVSPTPVHRYKTIDKMSFATEGTATYVGDLTANNGSTSAVTSATNGYVLGGATSNNPPAPVVAVNNIDKFPFATDANATDVGDLTEVNIQGFGSQN